MNNTLFLPVSEFCQLTDQSIKCSNYCRQLESKLAYCYTRVSSDIRSHIYT